MTTQTLPQLTIGAARVLAAHLAHGEWNKDIVKAYRAASLAKRIRRSTPDDAPEVKDVRNPTRDEERALRDWLDRQVEKVELSEKERELCRETLTFYAVQGKLRLDDDALALFDAIGMKPEAV